MAEEKDCSVAVRESTDGQNGWFTQETGLGEGKQSPAPGLESWGSRGVRSARRSHSTEGFWESWEEP